MKRIKDGTGTKGIKVPRLNCLTDEVVDAEEARKKLFQTTYLF